MGDKNPYAGQPEEAPYDQGYRDGLAEPDVSHPIPPEFADSDVLQDAYLRGEADGKLDVPPSFDQDQGELPTSQTVWMQVDQTARSLQEIPMSQVQGGQPAFSFKLEADPLCFYEDAQVRVTLKVSGKVTVSFVSATTCTVDMTSLPFSASDPQALGQFNDCAGWVLGQAKLGAAQLFATPSIAVNADRTVSIGGSISSQLGGASLSFQAPATWVISGSISPIAPVSTGAGEGKASASLAATVTITGKDPLPDAVDEASLWPLVIPVALAAPVLMTALETEVMVAEGVELAGVAARAWAAFIADTSTVLVQRLVLSPI